MDNVDSDLAPTQTGTDQPSTDKTRSPDVQGDFQLPERIGRYRVQSLLGKGGFGLVYLAVDEQLNRKVAIKVPHAHLVFQPEDADLYLAEARTVANLDHPHIVPVHDVGGDSEFPVFVVSKYIEGNDLAAKIKLFRLSHRQAAELVATIGDALHYAHKQGLVHRDIKPGNILIDTEGKPFVVDFGLALREENVGKGPRYLGTPAYMSPEQARGEGHRVDGRSDIFSLGMILFELLTGIRPFKADTQHDLMEQISRFEPRPPRQYDDTIPKELERICLKAMSKRAAERYTTAKDLVEDLRDCLTKFPHSATDSSSQPSSDAMTVPLSAAPRTGSPVSSESPISGSRPMKIVPKGLRSFDAHDADFFLELLPGARDRDGLPDSIRFWKTRIEEKDADNTFSVGLIYGPSGCGKTSLVKAGLIPRLSKDVISIYVESTANETETRLLYGLRKRFPKLSDNLSLQETLAEVRRGNGIPAGQKVVLILDQFEQWLHSKKGDQNPDLVQALRQCDGGRLQCIVMVRDDFWMAATRFLGELEIELLQGQNCAAVDLFDVDHSRRVLAAFGRAFGKLPQSSSELNKYQSEFLNRVVTGLAQEGKVISVRLALFAEMMRGKTWTPATLKEVGGTQGVGVTFLEETFSSKAANPKHRMYQKSAQSVLNVLLPDSGTDIKGHMRSTAQLMDASGYVDQPKNFEALIRILDGELRLITPTDPDGAEESTADVKFDQKYYQLTHDYLVPSLRDWLTQKQKETRRGRAELLLADRASIWNSRPENRQLPSIWQWMSICWLTEKKNWTPSQRKMMTIAGQYHTARAMAFGLIVVVATFAGFIVREQIVERQRADIASGLVGTVINAEIAQVPAIIDRIDKSRKWADPLLRDAIQNEALNSRQKLNASLALLPVDPDQVNYLYNRLLDAVPQEVSVIRDELMPYKGELVERLWRVVESPEKSRESQRLRAAAALAKYDPTSEQWTACSQPLVDQLVAENPLFLGIWMENFRPIRATFLPMLAKIFQDPKRLESERKLTTNILDDYAADQPELLANLVMEADAKQFAVMFPRFEQQSERGMPLLFDQLGRTLPQDAEESEKESLAKRQANAAVALFRLNKAEKVWPKFEHLSDPRIRSYLIHRMFLFGADPAPIIKRWEDEPKLSIRLALLLCLGEFDEDKLPPATRKVLTPKLRQVYTDSLDPGLHAAAEWLLRQWNDEEWLKQTTAEWVQSKERRNQRIESIQLTLLKDKERASRQWFVNGQGQTMVVIPGPVVFTMGSPLTEADRSINEVPHEKHIDRNFAIGGTLVTKEQFLKFMPEFRLEQMFRFPESACAFGGMDWYQAAEYCNWLSREEGISEDQWCYENMLDRPNAKLKKNHLSLSGYRLPTESETEYATRAGAITARCYGETAELLPKYAWFDANSQKRTWPVGMLKPNDFGLFDVHGNLWARCDESFKFTVVSVGEVVFDHNDEIEVQSDIARPLRGGSFGDEPSVIRSAFRHLVFVPSSQGWHLGFRLARTMPVGPTP